MKGSNHLRGQSTGKPQGDGFARFRQTQPMLARWSYGAGVMGALLAIHDFHHPHDDFGYSTPVLGLAIVLYLLSLLRQARARR